MTECRLLIVDANKGLLDQLEITIDREHKPYAEEKGIALSIEKAYSPADLKELDEKIYDIFLSALCLTDEDEEAPEIARQSSGWKQSRIPTHHYSTIYSY